MGHIVPFLVLPNLKTLIVENVTGYSESRLKRDTYEPPNNLGNLTLERLVFLNANIAPDAMRNLLDSLKALRTFIWEDNLPPYSLLGGRYSELPIHIGQFPFSEDHEDDEYLQTTEYSRQDEGGGMPVQNYAEECFETDFEPVNPDEQFTREHLSDLTYHYENDVRFWDPAVLLRQLALRYRHTLEHLSLTKFGSHRVLLFRRKGHILHFRNFTGLTHLEIDVRLLRPRRGSVDYEEAVDGIPASLASILPPSIRVVRLHVVNPYFEALHALLDGIPHEIARFPSLRRIRLIVNKNPQTEQWRLPAEWMEDKTYREFHSLREELNRLDVALTVEAVDCCQGRKISSAGPGQDR
jgi:hypothetical protein